MIEFLQIGSGYSVLIFTTIKINPNAYICFITSIKNIVIISEIHFQRNKITKHNFVFYILNGRPK